jgi:dihydrolipoamide dehydrogenase
MYDLAVIGSGPGGYISAIRAAQLDMDVACIEKYSTFGGTCLNVGCIPSKAMLEASHKYEEATEKFGQFGIDTGDVSLDLDKMLEHKDNTVGQLVKGVDFLFNKNGVDGIHGKATIVGQNTIEVDGEDETQTIEAENILIATGSKPAELPGVEFDDEYIVDSTGALDFQDVPDKMVVVGGGYIGVEMGSVWSRLGAEVEVLEFLPSIFGGNMDNELTEAAKQAYEKQGIEFTLNAEVTDSSVSDGEVELTYTDREDDSEQTVTADKVLVSVGRRPYTDGLGLDNVGLETDERGFIDVDDDFQTDVDSIYAIGDVVGDPMLAHKAEEEGVVCIERMNDIGAHINYDAIPAVVYTHPEVASVGKTEEELDEAGIDYNKGKFSYKANGRAKAMGETEGFSKILADAETDKILGAHIVGAHAGDLIAELAVASEFHASAEDVARSSHAHPTLAETVKEAALGVHDRILNS